jgi:hypothetical protein
VDDDGDDDGEDGGDNRDGGESACCTFALRAVRRKRMLAARRSLSH